MIQQLLQSYWPKWYGDTVNGPTGWNNTTLFIHNPHRRSVMRIYNTHRDKARIEFEFAVLDSLQRAPLSFKVPTPVPSTSGDKMVRVQAGVIDTLAYSNTLKERDRMKRAFKRLIPSGKKRENW